LPKIVQIQAVTSIVIHALAPPLAQPMQNRSLTGINVGRIYFSFLGHLLRDDLINPVKMSVRPYVRTSVRPQSDTMQPQTK